MRRMYQVLIQKGRFVVPNWSFADRKRTDYRCIYPQNRIKSLFRCYMPSSMNIRTSNSAAFATTGWNTSSRPCGNSTRPSGIIRTLSFTELRALPGPSTTPQLTPKWRSYIPSRTPSLLQTYSTSLCLSQQLTHSTWSKKHWLVLAKKYLETTRSCQSTWQSLVTKFFVRTPSRRAHQPLLSQSPSRPPCPSAPNITPVPRMASTIKS